MAEIMEKAAAEAVLAKKEELMVGVENYDSDKALEVFKEYFAANQSVNGEESGWYNEPENLKFIYNLVDKIAVKTDNIEPMVVTAAGSNLYMGLINYVIAAEFLPVADSLCLAAETMAPDQDELFAALFLRNENVDGPAYEAFVLKLYERGRNPEKIMKLTLNGLDKYCSDDFGFGCDIIKEMIKRNGGNPQFLSKICLLLGQYDFSNDTVGAGYSLIEERIDGMDYNDEVLSLCRIFDALRISMEYRASRATFLLMIQELKEAKPNDYAKTVVTTAREGMPKVKKDDVIKVLEILDERLYLPSIFRGLYAILSNNDIENRRLLLKGVNTDPEIFVKICEAIDTTDDSNILYVRVANQILKDVKAELTLADKQNLEKGVKKIMGEAFDKSCAGEILEL